MGQKVRADNIATQIEGVLTWDNMITVKAKTNSTSDAAITAAIVDELFWSFYVDGDRIGVTVKDGQAVWHRRQPFCGLYGRAEHV